MGASLDKVSVVEMGRRGAGRECNQMADYRVDAAIGPGAGHGCDD